MPLAALRSFGLAQKMSTMTVARPKELSIEVDYGVGLRTNINEIVVVALVGSTGGLPY